MEPIASKAEIEAILEDLTSLSVVEKIDFSDFEFVKMGHLLQEGPAKKFLPASNEGNYALLPPKNDNGEYHYDKDGEHIVVPIQLNALVEYAFVNFSSAAILPEKSAFELVWAYVERFMRWVFHIKQTLLGQLKDVLCDFDP
ncbi:MAG: hypothetical protein JXX14_24270 [Deltaproteobacteria bacterium]|nr:hypothetical protein [Deltaproteobacteria bacterium]